MMYLSVPVKLFLKQIKNGFMVFRRKVEMNNKKDKQLEPWCKRLHHRNSGIFLMLCVFSTDIRFSERNP